MMKFGYQLFNWILLVFFFFQRVLHPFMLKFGYLGARLDQGSGVWLGAIVPLGQDILHTLPGSFAPASIWFLQRVLHPFMLKIGGLGSEAGPGLRSVALGYSAFRISHPSHTLR